MGPLALNCAGKDYAQAVALLERQGPAFPAAREAVSPHGEQRVFPAPRGKRGSAALYFDVKNPVERALSV